MDLAPEPSQSRQRALGSGLATLVQRDIDNKFAEEPPEAIKYVDTRWQGMINALTDNEHVAIARELWDWFYDYLPGFGTVGIPKPVVMKQNFPNFPDDGVWGFSVIRAVSVNPEQFFFKS